jgi:cell envelope opacity-associated protein A
MPACATCGNDADIAYHGGGTAINYCETHIPNFLHKPEYSGHRSPIVAVEAPVIEATPAVEETSKPKPAKKKPVEETVVEEAPVEEPVVEEATENVAE